MDDDDDAPARRSRRAKFAKARANKFAKLQEREELAEAEIIGELCREAGVRDPGLFDLLVRGGALTGQAPRSFEFLRPIRPVGDLLLLFQFMVP